MKYENTVSAVIVLSLINSIKKLALLRPDTELPMAGLTLDPEDRVDEQVLIDLWLYIDKNVEKQGFALQLGQDINTATMGLLTSLVSQCESLTDGLINFIEHLDWMGPSEKWEMKFEGDYIDLIYSMDEQKGYPDSAMVKSMSMLLHWGQKLAPHEIEVISTHFSFSEPDDFDLYIFPFGKNIHFSAPYNKIRLKAEALNKKLISYNPYLKKLLKEKIKSHKSLFISKHERKRVIDKQTVINLIGILLPENKANIDIACDHLSVSRQTLYRHLQKENTSFKSLLNQVRKEKSITLLKNNELSISTISELLGYAEISSFYTAFNKWYGMSASQYRKTLFADMT